jgi:hypothetical protein
MNPLYWSVAIGVALGLLYTLSPLTVCFALAMIALLRWSGRGLADVERRWIQGLLLAAIAARVAAIAGLFLATDHARVPFGSFFGDEEYFIKRSLWLRNVALGHAIHRADLIYAFDDYSYTSYLYVLALLQVLFGPAPYGLHLFGASVYLAGAVLLFRLVQRSLGPVTAFGGLALLLFLPSLFAWSISALKEPLYFAIGAGTLVATVRAVREPRWKTRLALTLAIALAAIVMQTIREGGFAIAAGGIVGGLGLAALSLRPRIAWGLVLAAPFIVMSAWRIPDVQIASSRAVRQVAKVHWGHIQTAGYTYKVLDDRLYHDRSSIDSMDRGEALRYLVRAAVAYLTVPLPWKIEGRAALLYVPEQMVWFLMLALAPLGVASGSRRDPLVTWLLVAFALAAAVPVALTSGNVGTLVRHRGLAVPFLAWLSAAGVAELAVRLGRRSSSIDSGAISAPAVKVEGYALD